MSSAAFYNAVRPDGEFTADAEEGAMEYLVGVTLALGISCFSTLVRFDRDRAFYPTILIVIASWAVYDNSGNSPVLLERKI